MLSSPPAELVTTPICRRGLNLAEAKGSDKGKMLAQWADPRVHPKAGTTSSPFPAEVGTLQLASTIVICPLLAPTLSHKWRKTEPFLSADVRGLGSRGQDRGPPWRLSGGHP